MVARWIDTLPAPQADSMEYDAGQAFDVTDVLVGPSRTRLKRRNIGASYQFVVWMNEDDTESFEHWYDDVVATHDGEWYAPWIGHGVVLAFQNEYDLRPLGRGWQLSARVVEIRIDATLCDDHLSTIFGGVLRDDGVSSDSFLCDTTSTVIYRDDYSLDLIASEPC